MITLTRRGEVCIPVEAESLTPNLLQRLSPTEIASLPVQQGNAVAQLGDFFHITGDAADGQVTLEGDCSRFKHLGTGMTSGRLTIHGDAGMHLGAGMTGGEIVVRGNASDWTGAEMRGGHIHIHGDVGHLAGAGYRGSRHGMRGGVLLIDGSVGNEVGATMRRGLIAVGGSVGDFVGVSMIAGSIFVFGRCGRAPGAGMKRGTLAFLGEPPDLLPTFRYTCTYEPVFLAFYLRRLRAWGLPVEERHLRTSWRRFAGDRVALGKGEVLLRVE
jgi:formylmethanofuran dehydrogenase subunit C